MTKDHEEIEAPKGQNAESVQKEPAPGASSLPEVTFATFVLSLASSALVHLGEIPEPETGQEQKNLPLAKHTIDILSMLQEKIEQGLDSHEKMLLKDILYEVRMKYVMKK